ncbi:MAG: hypothetical protein GY934_17695 [Gammaproteobacteria bacterium]|nr:hypothetical protein [Gammaproteobacteria bacterium]
MEVEVIAMPAMAPPPLLARIYQMILEQIMNANAIHGKTDNELKAFIQMQCSEATTKQLQLLVKIMIMARETARQEKDVSDHPCQVDHLMKEIYVIPNPASYVEFLELETMDMDVLISALQADVECTKEFWFTEPLA